MTFWMATSRGHGPKAPIPADMLIRQVADFRTLPSKMPDQSTARPERRIEDKPRIAEDRENTIAAADSPPPAVEHGEWRAAA